MAKSEWLLHGINCAECLEKIEEKVRKIAGISDVATDFVGQRLCVEFSGDEEWIFSECARVVGEIEPRVRLLRKSEASEASPILLDSVKSPRFLAFVLGAILFGVAIFNGNLWFFIMAYILIGGEVITQAFKNLIRGSVFDENLLMSIATIGAFAIGEYPEGVAVMFFYRVGEFFQDLALERSRRSITSLMGMRPDFARVRRGSEWVEVSPESVEVGSTILVRAGERIALDGTVLKGKATLDLSALNGESLPIEVCVGENVLSGSVNTNSIIEVQTTKSFGESTLSKILDLVQNASFKKAKTEQFITKFARYYTPFVVVSAVLLAILPPLFVSGASFSEWFSRALVFLVVSCPCALVISIPLTFFAGIGAASRLGILVKGGNFLEALREVDTIVFDKTGTLTYGVFKVSQVMAFNGFSEEEIIYLCASGESSSNHPIAQSIVRFAKDRGIVPSTEISDYHEQSGYGVSVMISGEPVLLGNAKLMRERGIALDEHSYDDTLVYVAKNGVLAGCLSLRDEIKSGAKEMIYRLKVLGIKRIYMLSGDRDESAKCVASELGIEYVAGLLPHEKVEHFERLRLDSSRSAFVGDGINDAPVLALSDVGIAMGGAGSDAAIEAADVVIMNDELSRIASAIELAKRTNAIVRQNIIFALGVKGIILVLGAFGVASMWEAVFGDVGVALLAVLNAMRMMKIK